MKIVIVGDGKVGSALTEMLRGEGHDLTVIDCDPAVLKRQTEQIDVIGVLGNGGSYKVQTEAGVPEAELTIAVTSTDERNMICCLLAQKLGCPHTVARVRDPDYSEQLEMMWSGLGLSLALNPELSAAEKIARLLSFPSADSIGSLADGRVQVVEYTLPGSSLLCGTRLSQLGQKKGTNISVCAVRREGKVLIPKGDFRFLQGDHLYLAGPLSSVGSFLHVYGHQRGEIRRALVVGGGKIAYYLARFLQGSEIDLKILEKSPERCRQLAELLPDVSIAAADGSDRRVLAEEGLYETDALVALTNMDEENLLIATYSLLHGVPKVITKIDRDGYADIVEKIGLDSLINPRHIVADQVLQYVRALNNAQGSPVEEVYGLFGGGMQVVEFLVNGETALHQNIPLRRLPILPEVLMVALVRGQEVVVPTGEDSFHAGDRVVLATLKSDLKDLNDIFEP